MVAYSKRILNSNIIKREIRLIFVSLISLFYYSTIPTKYPNKIKTKFQMLTPTKLYAIKLLASILKVPASNVTTVLTAGIRRPTKHTLLPYFLLSSSALSKDFLILLNFS